ncbi:hypothetical protein [Desulfobacterium sp. N47]|uniref:Uncharacterized protein n=1 Tax=uncultured Desulfobacterium sp. TaxID=201089 RepID=E1YJN1_9BACT|nr:hypothetical protein N47_E49970 [uncultured Desulfobacterium sp.]
MDILTNEQFRDISRNLIKAFESRYRIVPLNSLKKTGYILKKPIYITIETDGEAIIASLDDIEAFSYADTEFEAINALCEEIVMLYEDMKTNRENLGILPQKWLEYLNEVITVDENI